MIASKYAEQFKRLTGDGKELYRLRGATLLVELMPKPELKSKGGIVLTTPDSHRSTTEDFRRQLGVVLLRGEGYSNGEEMDIEVGNVVLMPTSVMYLSEFPGLNEYSANSLALVSEDSILFSYRDIQAFEQATKLLASQP